MADFYDEYADVDDMDMGGGETEFKAEVNFWERVSKNRKLQELLSFANVPDWEKKSRLIKTPEDRFLLAVDELARRLHQDGIFEIPDQEIDDNLLEKTRYMNEIKYKNPAGYVLGYLASRPDRSKRIRIQKDLDPEKVKDVIARVPTTVADEFGITPPDIVRYARYWKLFL